jgi:hypothetical protein
MNIPINSFFKKSDAIEYYKKYNHNDLKLFAEDIKNNGSKRYYVMKYDLLFNKIINNEYPSYYEFWTNTTNLKFSVDLDIPYTEINNYNDSINIVKETIKKIIMSAKELYNHEYKINDFIILENESNSILNEDKIKFSYHIICNGLGFENYIVVKDFFNNINEKYNLKYCDSSIYNLSCLRICYCTKKGRQDILLPKVIEINNKNTFDFFLNIDPLETWKKTLITYIYSDYKIIPKTSIKNKIKEQKDFKKIINNIKIKEILYKLPFDYCHDYNKWIKIGMILFNISTPENNYYDLWNEWSKQSDKYNEKDLNNFWKNFKTNNINIGSLIYWCNQEGITDIYDQKTIKQIINDYKIKPIKLSNISLEVNMPKLNEEIFTPFLQHKLLGIQSEKGTGKTTNLLKCLIKNNIINKSSSVLFISARRTFGIKLLGDLEKYGFKLYSDIKQHDIYSNKIICQIDSLLRLKNDSYEYLIIDECESLVRYLTSQHFTKNSYANLVITSLQRRLNDAKHIYALDADLSDRSINYLKNNINIDTNKDNKCTIILNNFKPCNSYTFAVMKYNDWLVKIFDYIKENKKIVIPIASNNKAKDLVNKINTDYPDKKVLLIHKETSDEDKLDHVINVNKSWSNYDIVVYTPSVSMGISYDLENYFDVIFAYGCHNSLGAQEFCQMIHRVRHPKESTIYLSVDIFKDFNQDEDTYTYNEIENMLCSDYYLTHYNLYNNLLQVKFTRDENNDIILNYPYKDEPIYNLFINNTLETLENKHNFAACLFGYIKFKEYNIKFEKLDDTDNNQEILQEMKFLRKEREISEKEINTNGILHAKNITKEEYLQKIKQRNDYLSDDDIFEIYRYNIKSCYGITNEHLSENFINEYYDANKMKWYKNYTTILPNNEQSIDIKMNILQENHKNYTWINNCYIDFITKNQYSYHYYALMIIKILKFDISNLNIEIQNDEFINNLDLCCKWIFENKDIITKKYEMNKITNIPEKLNSKLKIINTILLSMYGIKIIYNKVSNIYKLSDNNIWVSLPFIPVSKMLELKEDNLENNIDDIDTSGLDIIR